MSSSKRPSSPVEEPSKRPRASPPPPPQASSSNPPSLHAWLHPNQPAPLTTRSPPLHDRTSTFVAWSIAFVAPTHITTESALVKEAKRVVRELNVVALVGDELIASNDGAFQDGEGIITNSKGKSRAREPDHRMWAVRTLALKEGRNGTKGEDDYQVSFLGTLSSSGCSLAAARSSRR